MNLIPSSNFNQPNLNVIKEDAPNVSLLDLIRDVDELILDSYLTQKEFIQSLEKKINMNLPETEQADIYKFFYRCLDAIEYITPITRDHNDIKNLYKITSNIEHYLYTKISNDHIEEFKDHEYKMKNIRIFERLYKQMYRILHQKNKIHNIASDQVELQEANKEINEYGPKITKLKSYADNNLTNIKNSLIYIQQNPEFFKINELIDQANKTFDLIQSFVSFNINKKIVECYNLCIDIVNIANDKQQNEPLTRFVTKTKKYVELLEYQSLKQCNIDRLNVLSSANLLLQNNTVTDIDMKLMMDQINGAISNIQDGAISRVKSREFYDLYHDIVMDIYERIDVLIQRCGRINNSYDENKDMIKKLLQEIEKLANNQTNEKTDRERITAMKYFKQHDNDDASPSQFLDFFRAIDENISKIYQVITKWDVDYYCLNTQTDTKEIKSKRKHSIKKLYKEAYDIFFYPQFCSFHFANVILMRYKLIPHRLKLDLVMGLLHNAFDVASKELEENFKILENKGIYIQDKDWTKPENNKDKNLMRLKQQWDGHFEHYYITNKQLSKNIEWLYDIECDAFVAINHNVEKVFKGLHIVLNDNAYDIETTYNTSCQYNIENNLNSLSSVSNIDDEKLIEYIRIAIFIINFGGVGDCTIIERYVKENYNIVLLLKNYNAKNDKDKKLYKTLCDLNKEWQKSIIDAKLLLCELRNLKQIDEEVTKQNKDFIQKQVRELALDKYNKKINEIALLLTCKDLYKIACDIKKQYLQMKFSVLIDRRKFENNMNLDEFNIRDLLTPQQIFTTQLLEVEYDVYCIPHEDIQKKYQDIDVLKTIPIDELNEGANLPSIYINSFETEYMISYAMYNNFTQKDRDDFIIAILKKFQNVVNDNVNILQISNAYMMSRDIQSAQNDLTTKISELRDEQMSMEWIYIAMRYIMMFDKNIQSKEESIKKHIENYCNCKSKNSIQEVLLKKLNNIYKKLINQSVDDMSTQDCSDKCNDIKTQNFSDKRNDVSSQDLNDQYKHAMEMYDYDHFIYIRNICNGLMKFISHNISKEDALTYFCEIANITQKNAMDVLKFLKYQISKAKILSENTHNEILNNIKKHNEILNNIEKELQTAEKELKTARGQLQNMQDPLHNTKWLSQDMQKKLQVVELQSQNMQKELQTTQAQLQNMQVPLQDMQKKLQAAQAQLQNTQVSPQNKLQVAELSPQNMQNKLQADQVSLQNTQNQQVNAYANSNSGGSTL